MATQPTHNKGGRVPLPPAERRDNHLHVLMNDPEYDALCLDARRAQRSINAYVRSGLEYLRAIGFTATSKPDGSSAA